MTYEIYRKIVSKEKYFDSWDSVTATNLGSQLQDQIYSEYLVKCEVFQRDKFTCQNKECKKECVDLTFHHVIFKEDGGLYTVNNGLTLCDKCHKNYHRAKSALVLLDGRVFQRLAKSTKYNWKKLKSEMKVIRKSVKGQNREITWDQISLILKWFFDQFEK